MKIYSYVVRFDTGFAPNPFWGYCTLATCKPAIRRKATKGDWIVGTGSVENVGNDKLVYAMNVTEVTPLEDYWNDKRFAEKKPGKGIKESVGDNIYYRDGTGVTRQYFPSKHSYRDRENTATKFRDLNGKNVLISKSGRFCYFGREAPEIPHKLSCIIKKGPGHKCNFSLDVIDEFLRWIQEMKPGLRGYPFDYPGQLKSCAKRESKQLS